VEVTSSRAAVGRACDEARRDGRLVGFVPTMGALHGGHARLVDRARAECGFVAVSIFVNPLQFTSPDDLRAYPRTLDRDLEESRRLGADVVFTPSEREMYPEGPPLVTVDPGELGGRLEGASRPGHFRGVLTVVAKLFHLVGPGRAYFGEKDAQQLELVRRMVADLDLPVEPVGVSTVREADGLALSSRNQRLTEEQRAAAPVLFDALATAATLARHGELDADVVRAEMARTIGAEPLARLDYVAVVDDASWEDVQTLDGPARALVAAWFGAVRLIDNVALPWPGGGSDPAKRAE
jgi:pantoate--beta-alanine ligase